MDLLKTIRIIVNIIAPTIGNTTPGRRKPFVTVPCVVQNGSESNIAMGTGDKAVES
jgi:hypothetical protein